MGIYIFPSSLSLFTGLQPFFPSSVCLSKSSETEGASLCQNKRFFQYRINLSDSFVAGLHMEIVWVSTDSPQLCLFRMCTSAIWCTRLAPEANKHYLPVTLFKPVQLTKDIVSPVLSHCFMTAKETFSTTFYLCFSSLPPVGSLPHLYVHLFTYKWPETHGTRVHLLGFQTRYNHTRQRTVNLLQILTVLEITRSTVK